MPTRLASPSSFSRLQRQQSTRRERRHAASDGRANTTPRPLAAVWAQLRRRTRIALIALTLAAIGGVALLAKSNYDSSLRQIRLYRDSLYPYKIGSPGPGSIAPS